jgi:hypothetical protein
MTLARRGVERRESSLLARADVSPVREQLPHDVGTPSGDRGVKRCDPRAVTRRPVRIGAAREEETRGIRMREEGGEPERSESVLGEVVPSPRFPREDLAEPLHVSDGAGLENVERPGAIGQNSRDRGLPAINGGQESGRARLPRSRERGISAEQSLDLGRVPLSDRFEESAGFVHRPVS